MMFGWAGTGENRNVIRTPTAKTHICDNVGRTADPKSEETANVRIGINEC